MTSHCSLVYERVCVCVYSRPSMIEGAGDSAETPRQRLPNPFRVVGKLTASFRPPPPLLHPLDPLSLHLPSGRKRRSRFRPAKEAHRGFQYGVRGRCKQMWLLCGCYSGHPCPLLDTGLVRLIVLFSSRAIPNALWSACECCFLSSFGFHSEGEGSDVSARRTKKRV